ncbi:hypothetical protein [Mucilaginibacter psychrotolerans]|uniref:Uncharacterized protein n=1 Tax=Mucilaginibacter psychrotolerans TaxID=1524096 RepID=A0A4Y8SDM3_9SPHI|nr:hypothetical protein [Mucilaginibacter psychrotolerans]TFF37119.1 hypothetical protein E2R66_13635 [Mucilaginibacter psychrotolerans]
MLIEFLGVVLLLALIVIPLMPRKAKPKPVTELKVNTDTHDAEYAINENGKLERIHHPLHY